MRVFISYHRADQKYRTSGNVILQAQAVQQVLCSIVAEFFLTVVDGADGGCHCICGPDYRPSGETHGYSRKEHSGESVGG